ncbi:MAG: VWA domain-containing protein [Acidobacteria bacterium]|nr:VWA domain-containing protein [Acidobacteriota bacterium]
MKLAQGLSMSLVAAMMASPAATQDEGGFVERIDVEVTSVDVFVRDADGNPVRGLTAEDFKIYEDGVEREISNFSEVAVTDANVTDANAPVAIDAGVPETPVFSTDLVPTSTQQHFIIYVESSALNRFSRDHAAEDLRELVRTLSDRSIPVMMVLRGFGGEADDLISFTTDSEQLEAMVEKIASSRHAFQTRRPNEMTPFLRHRFLALESVVRSVAGLEGRKAMVAYLGPGLRFAFTDSIQTLEGKQQEMAGMLGGSDKTEYASQPQAEPEIVELTNARSLIRGLVASANEADVTFYPVFGGGLSELESGISGAELMWDGPGNTLAPFEHTRGRMGDYPLFEFQSVREVFNYLARETGGLTAPPTNGFEHINRKAADDVSFYYSLGFRSESSPRRSSIRVEVDQPGVTVRHRLEVLRITPRERAELQTIASLVLPETIEQPEELRFESRVLGVERESWRRNIVSLELSIPYEELVLHSGDRGLEGAFTVLIAASDGAGKLSKVAEQTHRFELEERDRLALEGDSYAYVVPMRMRRGEHVLVVTVMDETSQIRGIRKITIPSG